MRIIALLLSGALFLPPAAFAGQDLLCGMENFDINAQDNGVGGGATNGEVVYFASDFCNRVNLDHRGKINTDVVMVDYSKDENSVPITKPGEVPAKGMDPEEIFEEYIARVADEPVVFVRVVETFYGRGTADLQFKYIEAKYMTESITDSLTN